MTPTYIIQSHAYLGYDIGASTLATALGCVYLIPEWDGHADLDYGACAFVSGHHAPPFGACVVQIADAADLRRMAQSIIELEINPPHIDIALSRITLGVSSEREAKQLAEHIATLRERCAYAERQLSCHEGHDPQITLSACTGVA